MPMKATMIFRLGSATWSEAHYSGTLTDPTTPAAAAAAIQLAKKRVPLLGGGAFLVRLRLSRTDIPRVVVNPSLAGVVTGQIPDAANYDTFDAAPPNNCAVVRVDNNAGSAANLYLGGVPQGALDITDTQPQYWRWNSGYVNLWNAYVAELIMNWKFRTVLAQVGVPVQALLNTLLPSPAIQLNTAVVIGPNLVAPFEVTLSGFRRSNTRLPGLSGIYTVTASGPAVAPLPGFLYTLGETGNVEEGNFTKLGKVALFSYAYTGYANINVTKAGTRKRGGSQGAPRGRSRPRT